MVTSGKEREREKPVAAEKPSHVQTSAWPVGFGWLVLGLLKRVTAKNLWANHNSGCFHRCWPVKFCGTSVKTMLLAEADGLTSEPGRTVSYASPMNPGCGTLVKQL